MTQPHWFVQFIHDEGAYLEAESLEQRKHYWECVRENNLIGAIHALGAAETLHEIGRAFTAAYDDEVQRDSFDCTPADIHDNYRETA